MTLWKVKIIKNEFLALQNPLRAQSHQSYDRSATLKTGNRSPTTVIFLRWLPSAAVGIGLVTDSLGPKRQLAWAEPPIGG